MENFTPLKAKNEDWGFWGTSICNGYNPDIAWNAVSHFLIKQFGLTIELTRDVLDSRFGRHLADELNLNKDDPANVNTIENHLRELIADEQWHRYFTQAITETKIRMTKTIII